MPDIGKSSKVFDHKMVSEFGTILCSDMRVHNFVLSCLTDNSSNQPSVIMLGSFYKRGYVEIKVECEAEELNNVDVCRTQETVRTGRHLTNVTGWFITLSRDS